MKNQSIENFYDARFGLFIHWGLYSLLAGEWQGKRMDDIGEWIMSYHKIPIAEYEKLAGQFNPTAFDAEAIVTMAKKAGMHYLVITSKHHEGFALFRSKADPYNVVDATPFGRDIIAELALACRRHDMKFGLYYSQALDWHERNAGGWDDPAYTQARRPWGNIWDFPDPAGKDFEEYFSRKVLPQVTELLTRYGDIFLLWFDTPRTITTEQSKRLYDMVKSLQPNCLVNSRIGNGLGDYASLGDNQLPAIPLAVPSESPVTLNDTWGYKHYDHEWKDSRNIIDKLIRLAAKNANFLLNIGPRGDGSIPEDTVRILSEVGDWTSQNQEGLFGTRGSPCRHDFLWGSMTSKGTQLYCFPDDNQKEKLTINGLNTPVRQVVALEQGKPVPFSQTPLLDSTSLAIDLVPTAAYRPAYRIDLEDEPVFSEHNLMQDENKLALYPHLASAILADQPFKIPQHGMGDRYKTVSSVAISSAGTLVGWSDPDLILCWDAWITTSGSYRAQLQMPVHYKQNPVKRNHQLIMKVEQQDYSGQTTWSSVLDSGLAESDEVLDLQAGNCRMTLQVAAFDKDQAMALQSIVFVLNSWHEKA